MENNNKKIKKTLMLNLIISIVTVIVGIISIVWALS
ncbi:hypothetical protein SAMN05216537_102214 [Lachnospira multipara]|uniref:Uncharacterized protein n=1 Tax=Lachnospira multipara TaxID=28051 RepID=A0A1H5SF55_9FIRM|nr:hypothetical protein SAMN05216537_102214 [Lachnospira multipara]